jgi:hypothetical protein
MEFLCAIPFFIMVFVIASLIERANKTTTISSEELPEEELPQALLKYKYINNIIGRNYESATHLKDQLHRVDPKFPPHL